MRDAAFGLAVSPDQWLLGRLLPGYNGQASFDDAWQYWYPEKPDAGVQIAATGVSFKVTAQNARSLTVNVDNVP